MSYEIHLNGRPFGTGVDGEGFSVPAYGEETVTVFVTSNLTRVYEQFREIISSGARGIRYGIAGDLSIDGALGKVPFEYEGELDLGRIRPPPRGKII